MTRHHHRLLRQKAAEYHIRTQKYTKLHQKIWHKITQKYTHTHNKTIKTLILKDNHIKEECESYGWSTALPYNMFNWHVIHSLLRHKAAQNITVDASVHFLVNALARRPLQPVKRPPVRPSVRVVTTSVREYVFYVFFFKIQKKRVFTFFWNDMSKT